uniref:Arginase n=1 Tax=Neobodo designis TaxID=312471 RepID=A0A7S1MN90_NEODS|mmetsp:Transcript_44008/g.135849  ORF Transcript_44008/g.135849 Transcript_44008/m.135849 type:complete len:290 (+) Transcript_44008:211-1080(+)
MLDLITRMGWSPKIVRVAQRFEASPEGTKLYQPMCVAATCNDVAKAMTAEAEAGNFPMLIGGDHCLAMGSVIASARRHPNLCVVWFDAHADVNTEDTSPTGNMHGMPLAGLLGLEAMKNAPGFSDGQFKCLKPQDVGYVGLRDVDEGEYEYIRQLGINTAYHMPDLKNMGITTQLKAVLDKINPNRDRPIHLSFDVDGMDPIDAPSTGTPVPGGVRFHEAVQMVKELRETGLLVSMDIVEVNPALGDAQDVDVTVRNARWILAHALGINPKSEDAMAAARTVPADPVVV